MLERIHIENYKCLRDVTVDLGDFTILIGPNDSGKSSFLEVIQTLSRLVQPNHPNFFGGGHSPATLVWRKDVGRYIVIEAAGTSVGHRFVYHLEVPAQQGEVRESLDWD